MRWYFSQFIDCEYWNYIFRMLSTGKYCDWIIIVEYTHFNYLHMCDVDVQYHLIMCHLNFVWVCVCVTMEETMIILQVVVYQRTIHILNIVCHKYTFVSGSLLAILSWFGYCDKCKFRLILNVKRMWHDWFS